MPSGHPWPTKIKDRAIKMRERGVPVSKVSKTLGVPEQTIHVWMCGQRKYEKWSEPFKWEMA